MKSMPVRYLSGVLLSAWTISAAAAITVADVQRLLESAPLKPVEFVETRESPWLAQPVETRGVLLAQPDVLEKRIRSPREEIWRLLSDRVEFIDPAHGSRKELAFSQSPALGVLSDTLRRLVNGDLAALKSGFRIDADGDERSWKVRLTAAEPAVADVVDYAELEGSGNRLRMILIVDRRGNRTTTRLER